MKTKLKRIFSTNEMKWNNMQQPIHVASFPADQLRFLSALDSGWMVTDVAEMIAHGRNDGGRSYVLTLAHMQKLLVKEMIVTKGKMVDSLLDNYGVPPSPMPRGSSTYRRAS
jgi:hypothetical protein